MSFQYLLIATSVLFNTAGQFFAKSGALRLETDSSYKLIKSFILNPFVMGAVVCYGASLIVWVYVLSKMPLSFAASLFAISYVTTVFLGVFVFNEALSPQCIVGTLLITGGIYLVSSCA
ncbi:MAG: EamA family transporter [Holosporaceae bacterium]